MAWGLRQMSSRELTAWQALGVVEAEEADAERERLDASDGEVIYHNRDEEPDDDGESDGEDPGLA